jgi:membrane fusion protein, multidrug efflux system
LNFPVTVPRRTALVPRPRRALRAVLGLGALALATAAAQAQAPAGGADAPPPAVVVQPVTSEVVGRSDQFVGRVEGFLETLNFKEGADVTADELLIGIEKAPYEAQLAAATAQVTAAQSQVAGAQANLANNDVILSRQVTLLKRGDVSQATYDQAKADRDVSAAQVQEAQAAVGQAQAQVQTAQLNLSYTDIKAPISGRIGAVSVTVGNLVAAKSGTIATIVQLDPIRVAFSIPEALYTRLKQRAATQNGNLDVFTPELTLSDGTTYASGGKLSFASNVIGASTGTLTIYADFPNADSLLLPGGFVTVTVKEANPTKLPVVPASAVLQDRDGRYVLVVDDANRAEIRRIETGQQVQTGFPVTKGLIDGERVIVEGLQKVRPGIVVAPTPVAAGSAEAAGTAPAAGAAQ